MVNNRILLFGPLGLADQGWRQYVVATMSRAGVAWLTLFSLFISTAIAQQPPADGTWTYDSALEVEQSITDLGLGAVQGVVMRDGKVYAYGDVVFAKPRIGVIREYNDKLEATGRVVWLRKDGKPLITHPTGLTWREPWGTFLGDTVKSIADPTKSRAVIYRLDWEKAWKDGSLDNAILDVVEDDAAVNGCRPEFVTLDNKPLLASADYGEIRPEIRLYDPDALIAAHRSSAPGVVVHRVSCGAFNQNLHWNAESGHLICVLNVIAGRGWRLDELDLAAAVKEGRFDGPKVRAAIWTFASHDELEGYWPLATDRGIFAVARRKDNLFQGTFHRTEPQASPPRAAKAETPAKSASVPDR